tara:strand:+ start:1363 stop:1728 length:366 start_codon:yes stop_codon:yes gene_type:complete
VASLSQNVLDTEANEIVCEDFLSQHNFADVPKVLDLILSKLRLNGTIKISENDFGMISRQIFREEVPLEIINEKVFPPKTGAMAKSMLNLDFVKNMLTDKFQITNANYGSHRFSLEARRVK